MLLLLSIACIAPPVALDPDTGTLTGDSIEQAGGTHDTVEESEPPDSEGGGSDSDSEDDGPTDEENEALYQALYDPTVIQEVFIELTDDAIQSLNINGREYVSGNVIVNGTRLDNVGVRLKGDSTYQDFSGKPAFKIKFDEYEDQEYAGLERMTLNNMLGDYTQSKEVIDYQVWAVNDIPAPRATYARVYVNEEFFGLYTNIEAMDEKWLKRRFADPSGDLWAAEADSAEFGHYGLQTRSDGTFKHWALNEGVGNYDAMFAVKAVLDDPSGDFFADMDTVIDAQQFVQFWAWCIVIGNQDGYPFHLDDVILYGDPEDGGRLNFSPWGMDEAWDASIHWTYAYGRIASYCMQDPVCMQTFRDDVAIALDAYETVDVMGLAEAAWELSQESMMEDPRRPYAVRDVEAYRGYLAGTIAGWPDFVRQLMGF